MKMLRWAAAALLALAVAPAGAQLDRFSSYSDSVSTPCRRWAAITPSDSSTLTEIPKALYVGGAGDVAMVGVDASTGASSVTWKAVPAGTMLAARPRQVLATGTSATSIVGCF